MPARSSPASIGRPRPVPHYENILAEADKDMLGSRQSPRDTSGRYLPTGRMRLDCLLPCTANAASWICQTMFVEPSHVLLFARYC